MAKRVPPSARNHSIVWIRLRSHNNSKTSWLELAEVAKRWKTWLELDENLSSIKFKPTRSISSQLKPSGWSNDTQLHRKLRTWLELVWDGKTVWAGHRSSYLTTETGPTQVRFKARLLVPVTIQFPRFAWRVVLVLVLHSQSQIPSHPYRIVLLISKPKNWWNNWLTNQLASWPTR